MKTIVLVAFLLACLHARPQAYYKRQCGFAAIGCIVLKDYVPPRIRSMQDLPDSARSRLESFMEYYLTPAFYRRLTLQEGYALDTAMMKAACPEIRAYQWKVPAYELKFSFSDSLHQVAEYSFCIEISQRGQVIDNNGHEIFDMEITRLSALDSITLISARDAVKTLRDYKRHNVYAIELSFYKGRMAWYIHSVRKRHHKHSSIKNVYLDMHSGKII